MIKRIIASILLMLGISAVSKAETYFQYPIVPDSITSFTGRCDYLAEHFFDFCDLQKAFSNRQRMGEEFKVYLTILSNARADVAVANAEALMKRLEKQPQNQLYLANLAEGSLYGDTATVWIDGLYLPFAKAVADNKRLDKAERARFEHQATTLANSLTGKRIAPLKYTLADGSVRTLGTDTAAVTVVFFNDPGCSDCSMARLRLHADISTSQLIDEGRLKVIAISLADPSDEEWRRSVADFPSTWTVGANPDADLTIDLRDGTPDFYVLDSRNRVKFKHLGVDQVIDISRQLKGR